MAGQQLVGSRRVAAGLPRITAELPSPPGRLAELARLAELQAAVVVEFVGGDRDAGPARRQLESAAAYLLRTCRR